MTEKFCPRGPKLHPNAAYVSPSGVSASKVAWHKNFLDLRHPKELLEYREFLTQCTEECSRPRRLLRSRFGGIFLTCSCPRAAEFQIAPPRPTFLACIRIQSTRRLDTKLPPHRRSHAPHRSVRTPMRRRCVWLSTACEGHLEALARARPPEDPRGRSSPCR